MILTHIVVNENLEEKIEGMDSSFPYICVYVEMDKYPGGLIPWHWHDEFEIICVIKGNVEYHINDKIIRLLPGDACFINSGVLHTLMPSDGCPDTVLVAHTFRKEFICGSQNSVFESKYVKEILSDKGLRYLAFRGQESDNQEILKLIREAYRIAEQEPHGFEFRVRNMLSDIWLLLLEAYKDLDLHVSRRLDLDNSRVKKMISFIQTHYDQRILAKDIAKSADVSERICYKCFLDNLGMTPGAYLANFRMQEAERLLVRSDMSVTEIAGAVGYSSLSYFSKEFCAQYGVTPKRYRMQREQFV